MHKQTALGHELTVTSWVQFKRTPLQLEEHKMQLQVCTPFQLLTSKKRSFKAVCKSSLLTQHYIAAWYGKTLLLLSKQRRSRPIYVEVSLVCSIQQPA